MSARLGGARLLGVLCAGVLSFVLVQSPAEAMGVDLGASVGGMLAGNAPRFAVSPYVTLSWPLADNFTLGVNEMASLLLAANNHGPGFYNHVSGFAAITWTDGKILGGPSLAIFSMPACGPKWCGNLSGFGAGGTLRLDLFQKPLGLSLGCNFDVPLKSTDLLPGGPALMFVAGAYFARCEVKS